MFWGFSDQAHMYGVTKVSTKIGLGENLHGSIALFGKLHS